MSDCLHSERRENMNSEAVASAAGRGRGDRVELLCNVRGLLKKIKQSVLVGDRVKVAGIDWEDRRGIHPCPSAIPQ